MYQRLSWTNVGQAGEIFPDQDQPAGSIAWRYGGDMQYVCIIRNTLCRRDLKVFGPFQSTADILTWLRRVDFPKNYTWDIHKLQSGAIEKGKRYGWRKQGQSSSTKDEQS